jgi:hypothetical protein
LSQFLKEVEENYNVAGPRINGKQAWPVLRVPFATAHIRNLIGTPEISSGWGRKLGNISSALYGCGNWLGKYEYIFFTSSRKSSFKNIKGKAFDRFADPIIEHLGVDKALKIEAPAPTHIPFTEISAKHVVSVNLPNTIAEIRGIIGQGELKIEGEDVLQKIVSDYDIQINYRRILARFEKRYRIYLGLLRRYHPRAVFLICYYDEISRVKAAKDLGIPVVEIQHGSIGAGHEAYNVFTDLDRSYFPDYMLVFGERDRETFANNLFVDERNVYPVGSFYIDYLKNNRVVDESITKRLQGFDTRVAVTLQSTVEDEFIDFIKRCAKVDPRIAYVLIPRHPTNRDYHSLKSDNIILFEDREFYEMMNYVDIHTTVYSGCALETPSFGVPNILVDLYGLSKMYLYSLLDASTTRYVETPTEFVEAVKRVKWVNKEKMVKANEPLIKPNYSENLRVFLDRFLKTR